MNACVKEYLCDIFMKGKYVYLCAILNTLIFILFSDNNNLHESYYLMTVYWKTGLKPIVCDIKLIDLDYNDFIVFCDFGTFTYN